MQRSLPVQDEPVYDEIVGLDLVAAMAPARRRRFHEQLAGIALPAPLVPSGLRPFLHLPPPEAATTTRARMAAAIAERVAATGAVSRDDLLAAGFAAADIARHFRGALRASGAARMAV